MLNEFLATHYLLHWWLLACGGIVTCVLAWFASGVVLEIIHGFGRAIDFQTFKKKVAKADGTVYKFRWRFFFGAWFNLTGFTEGTTITTPAGHRYLGFRKHVILGKFVNTPNDNSDDDSESDSDDD